MEKLPRKISQWAEEAFGALDIAWGLLMEEYPFPDESQKLELVRFAPAIAGMNRGITDKSKVKEAYDVVFENLGIDLNNKESDEPIHYSICFLLAYLDSQVSFGFMNERTSDEVMRFLCKNYEINNEV